MTAFYVVVGIIIVGLVVYCLISRKKGPKEPTVPPETPTSLTE